MDAQNFGHHVAEKLAYGGASAMANARPTGAATPQLRGPQNASSRPRPAVTTGGQLLSDMSSNSQRVGGGILSTVAGGIGALGTGALAGYTNMWNDFTPKFMNTSEGWSKGINDVARKATDFTVAGAKDVYGGLGGDTNYNTQQSWNKMQQGFNDPAVDPLSRRVAEGAAWTGHAAANAAMMVGNPGKILTNAPRAGINPRTWTTAGTTLSKIIPGARGGVQTASTAHRATPAMATAGRAANIAYDGGGGVIEGANFANQGQRFLAQRFAGQQPPAQPTSPAQPQESYTDLAAQQNNAQAYGTYMRDTLSGNPTNYSYSQAWSGG